jgi:hypothetical protein
MLLDNYRSLLNQGWQPVFAQPRSHQRALEHALLIFDSEKRRDPFHIRLRVDE